MVVEDKAKAVVEDKEKAVVAVALGMDLVDMVTMVPPLEPS
jgi:hypothetical protein